jgi:hypothetical protein
MLGNTNCQDTAMKYENTFTSLGFCFALFVYNLELLCFFSVFRNAEVSDCGQWLVVMPQKECRDNLIFFSDLKSLPDNKISGKVNLTQVVHKLEADYEVMVLLY